MKTCSYCKKDLEEDQFYPHSSTGDRLRAECKSCTSLKRKEHYMIKRAEKLGKPRRSADSVSGIITFHYKSGVEVKRARYMSRPEKRKLIEQWQTISFYGYFQIRPDTKESPVGSSYQIN